MRKTIFIDNPLKVNKKRSFVFLSGYVIEKSYYDIIIVLFVTE